MAATTVLLGIGLVFCRPDAGMVAAGGAMSTGSGSFQWPGRSRVQPMFYAVCLTAYIVFLLDFGGLSPAGVVANRTMNTALGGALAMLSYLTVLTRRRPVGDLKNSTPETRRPPPPSGR